MHSIAPLLRVGRVGAIAPNPTCTLLLTPPVGTEYHTVDRLRNVYSTSHLLHYRLSMERLPPVGQRMHGNRRADKKRIRALGFADIKRHQSAHNRRASTMQGS